MKQYNVLGKALYITLLTTSLLTACNSGGGGGANNGSNKATAMASAIVGTWNTSCISNGSGLYFILNEIFNADGTYQTTQYNYTDNICTQQSNTSIIDIKLGTYSLGNAVLAASGETAVEFNANNTGGATPNIEDIVYIDSSDLLYFGSPLTLSTTRPTDLDFSHPLTRYVAPPPVTQANFVGTWHTECLEDLTNYTASNPVYFFDQRSFDNSGNYTEVQYSYSEPTCSIPSYYLGKLAFMGTYTAESPFTTPTGRNVTPVKIDVTSTNSSIYPTPFTSYAILSDDNGALWFQSDNTNYPTDINVSDPKLYYHTGSVPTPGKCMAYDVPGEPDILDDVTFNVASVNIGTSVSVTVPVDADTSFVMVSLIDLSNGLVGGTNSQAITAGTAQNVKVVVPTTSTTSLHNYVPLVTVCTDISACQGAGSGTAVSYSPMIGSPARLDRKKSYDNGMFISGSYYPTCITNPELTTK